MTSPNTMPPESATPPLSKKNILPTTPENQVQIKKKSGTADDANIFLRSILSTAFNNAINPMPVSSHPKAFDSGISGWNGT
jgi:hypothetical protein